MSHDEYQEQNYTGHLEGRESKDDILKITWRRTVAKELKSSGHTWGTTQRVAQDRGNWRTFVAALHAGTGIKGRHIYNCPKTVLVARPVLRRNYNCPKTVLIGLSYDGTSTAVLRLSSPVLRRNICNCPKTVLVGLSYDGTSTTVLRLSWHVLRRNIYNCPKTVLIGLSYDGTSTTVLKLSS
ncbi:hypothetical protein Bbelb_101020 [Branchiostoma belcheri]|nr:hypothetical protein Bbelb_101020 [Branchiostoma belcheri]